MRCAASCFSMRAKHVASLGLFVFFVFFVVKKHKVSFALLCVSLCFLVVSPACLCAASVVATPAAPAASVVASPADLIAQAIATRTPIAFQYAGAERIVHPHRLGRHPKTGRLLLRAWERSKAAAPTGQWKLYALDRLSNLRTLPAEPPFSPAPGYTPTDNALPNPLAELPCP